MRFEKLDLNLLVALVSLVETRSVSDTAAALHLSQPTISAALRRLRSYFDDELLVQTGREMVPTPLGLEIAEGAAEVLNLTRFKVIQSVRFDPSISQRSFKIVASDYAFELLLAKAFSKINQMAKHLRFEVLPIGPQTVRQFEKGNIDLLITIDCYGIDNFPKMELFQDHDVLICWDQSNFANGVSPKEFDSAEFAIAAFGEERRRSVSEMHFEKLNIKRNIPIIVSSFSALPSAVIGTNRLAVVHKMQAELFKTLYPISIHPLPIPSADIRQIAQWHRLRQKDSGLMWLLNILKEEAKLLREQL